MEREIARGIVRKIENINKHLSFITLRTIEDESYQEIRVPFYMQVAEKYHGRVVDIITQKQDYLIENLNKQYKEMIFQIL